MSPSSKVDVVIIGGGPGGISAAIWCKRLGINHLLIESAKQVGGQLPSIPNKIIDYPGHFNRTGPEIQHLFSKHLEAIGSKVMTEASVKKVDRENKVVLVDGAGGMKRICFQFVVMATGSSQRLLGIPGEAEMIARGEVYSATHDSHRFTNKAVVVIGGGDRAFEGALLLAEAGADVTLVHRSDQFRARDEFRHPVFNHPNIQVKTFAVATAILGDEEVEGVEIVQNQNRETIHADAVFVRIGVKPNSELASNLVTLDEGGYIRTDKTGQTSDPSIYAVGDVCTSPLLTSITSSTGQGMLAVKQISFHLEQ